MHAALDSRLLLDLQRPSPLAPAPGPDNRCTSIHSSRKCGSDQGGCWRQIYLVNSPMVFRAVWAIVKQVRWGADGYGERASAGVWD